MRLTIAPFTYRLAVALTGLVVLVSDARAQDYPACHQDHPNGARRTESLIKAGDAKMAHKAAGHTVIYAVHRYGLQEFFGDEEIKAAADEMYNFLKWKLGSPLLVASQWGTGGYQHFDRTYVDEAAAMLLGVIDFEHVEPELKIPPFLQDWLQSQVGKTSEAVSVALVAEGVPPIVAEQLGKLAEQALQGLYDRNKVGVFMPKSYDVDNRLVETAVLAKRGFFRPDKFGKRDDSLPGPGGYGTRGTGGSSAPGGGRAFEPPADTIPAGSPSTAALEMRLAELEARVAELERRLSTTVGAGGPGGEGVKGRGYESIALKYHTYSKNSEIHVAVNDLLVGIYTQNNTLDLTPFLVSGRMNKVSYIGTPASDGISQVTIYGRLSGVEQDMKIYDVTLAEDRASDGISIPVVAGG